MFTLELRLKSETRHITTLSGTVRNVGTTPEPRLQCSLATSGDGPRLCGTSEAPYAWSTPLAALVEQAIAAALARDRTRRIDVLKLIGTAELFVFANRRELCCWTSWRVYDDLVDEDGMWPQLERSVLTPWELARRMLRRSMSSPKAGIGAMAPPRKRMPPIHTYRGIEYCRSTELPPTLREQLEYAHRLAPQPAVKDVPDAFFPHDVQRLLALRWWDVLAGSEEAAVQDVEPV